MIYTVTPVLTDTLNKRTTDLNGQFLNVPIFRHREQWKICLIKRTLPYVDNGHVLNTQAFYIY